MSEADSTLINEIDDKVGQALLSTLEDVPDTPSNRLALASVLLNKAQDLYVGELGAKGASRVISSAIPRIAS